LNFGSKGLLEGNPELIYNHITFLRGNIFRVKYMKNMKKGTLAQIETLLKRLPSVKEIGCENFIDLLTVKTRPPNYTGVEQARLDNILFSYMPLLQKDVIDPIFSMSLYWRKNGRYFRRIIKKFRPELRKYSIPKGNNQVPYMIPTSVASGYVKLKNKIFKSHQSDYRTEFYQNIKEHVLMLIDSNDFKNFSPYNHKVIKNVVRDFYSGSLKNVNTLDWWYTFEIWRRELGIE
ncbi:MAG: hypothetical protein P8Y62_01735, partial [candidate division WOR-3 bacterium]